MHSGSINRFLNLPSLFLDLLDSGAEIADVIKFRSRDHWCDNVQNGFSSWGVHYSVVITFLSLEAKSIHFRQFLLDLVHWYLKGLEEESSFSAVTEGCLTHQRFPCQISRTYCITQCYMWVMNDITSVAQQNERFTFLREATDSWWYFTPSQPRRS